MSSAAKSVAVERPAAGLSDQDLAWLVCPVCRSALHFSNLGPGASMGIRCSGCERCYPVVDGLPVLLADRATATSATKV